MATIKLVPVAPPPPPDRVTLDLSMEEAQAIKYALQAVRYPDSPSIEANREHWLGVCTELDFQLANNASETAYWARVTLKSAF